MRSSRLSVAALAVACLAATFGVGTAGAQSVNPPDISPIVATFSFPTTTYDVLANDIDGDTLTYRWTKTNERDCGTLGGANTSTFTWSHPHPPCPAEDFHPGTISVVVSDGTFRCKATYPYGSREGAGPEPEPCTASSTPGSVFCPTLTVAHGGFAPTQGVWQDDDYWADKPGKRLKKISSTRFRAELDMVKSRPSVLVGIDHADNEAKHLRDRNTIEMHVVTTGTKKVSVKMKFSLTEGGATREIYTSPSLGRVPLLKPCGKRTRWRVPLAARTGVPTAAAFTFNSTGDYVLEDELIRGDTGDPTGLKVTVVGKTVETRGPTTLFQAAALTTSDATRNQGLIAAAQRLADESRKLMPDYLPIPPNGITTLASSDALQLQTQMAAARQQWLDWATGAGATSATDLRNFRSQSLMAEASRLLTAWAQLARVGRMVVVLDDSDLEAVNPWPFDIGGLATSQKAVLVQSDEGHSAATHEITHTLPYVWLDDQQQPCGAPNYHNKSLDTAYGLQLTSAGSPMRKRWNGARSYMESHQRDSFWIDQCTYWHLLKQLQAPIDPPVLLVQGRIARTSVGAIGELYPMYEMDGVSDLEAGSKAGWAVVLRRVDGSEIARYPFNPTWEYGSHPERPVHVRAFSVQVPAAPDVATVELTGPKGNVLDSLVRSANAPTVTISQPRANSTVTTSNGTVEVTWTGTDRDGDALLYTVLYSSDGGENWLPQVLETSATSAQVAVDGTEHMVKVIATDGARSSEKEVAFKTR